MIINKIHQCTRLEVWFPRYSDQYKDTTEKVALLAQYKVDQASPVIIVDFTKAKHLKGQRYCIFKQEAMKFPIDSNGKIPCYAVPMSAFETWETGAEARAIAFELFPD